MDEILLYMFPQEELKFDFNLGRVSISAIQLKNNVQERVAFKIKTNAPRSYLVRPHSGILYPDETVEILITMQPLNDFPSDLNHIFLIQATKTYLEVDSTDKLSTFWVNTNKDQIQCSKLRVTVSKSMSEISGNTVDTNQSIQQPVREIQTDSNQQKASFSVEDIKNKYIEAVDISQRFIKEAEKLAHENSSLKQAIQNQQKQAPQPQQSKTLISQGGFIICVILFAMGFLFGKIFA